ncbi:helix-turn-helix domain-containing protein [Streptomyces odonnellii]|uniref:helix-turn-helix domain-containing protein n=1 Tax=Streptomyces odonnellii TaxID=1417980 RepID=UPI0006266712|nr:helix-turn-helix transcriptional regulator [Streptomyces odonnellii]
MSTDFQSARIALGARLRELRTDAGLNGRQLALLLGWQPSKISRLENGKQTAAAADLEAWALAVAAPHATADLLARLRNLELQHQSWRRQLTAGHRAIQDRIGAEQRATTTWRGYEAGVVPGLFQTPDYARHVFLHSATEHRSPRDTEDAVRARMKRQDVLYEPGKTFRVLLWEAALHVLLCPRDTMAAQVDRLAGLIGRDNIELGIIPLGAPMTSTAKHGFWILDERRVTVETASVELRLDAAHDVELYGRIWDRLNSAAVYGPPAHRLLARAQAALARS